MNKFTFGHKIQSWKYSSLYRYLWMYIYKIKVNKINTFWRDIPLCKKKFFRIMIFLSWKMLKVPTFCVFTPSLGKCPGIYPQKNTSPRGIYPYHITAYYVLWMYVYQYVLVSIVCAWMNQARRNLILYRLDISVFLVTPQ